jgi:hypothetical protein
MAKATEPASLLVVLVSFAGTIGGKSVSFVAGRLIEPDHPAVKAWPERFGPPVLSYPVKRTAEPRVEQATSAPGEKRGA